MSGMAIATGPVSSFSPKARVARLLGPTNNGPPIAPSVPPQTTIEMARARMSGRLTSAAMNRES